MTSTSDQLLRGLPLFAGLELAELAGLVGSIDLAAGEELWRQGEPADALYVVETGSLAVAARLPGERDHTLATLGAHEVLGELALLDGGVRTASVRALEPTRLLRLARADFRALVSRRDDSARTLRRRLTDLACTRLRERHRALAATLSGALAASDCGAGRGRPASRSCVSAPAAVLPRLRRRGPRRRCSPASRSSEWSAARCSSPRASPRERSS